MDTEPKNTKVIVNLPTVTIPIEVVKGFFLNPVDEEERVIPTPKFTADMSESVRPNEDKVAIYHFLPFNPQNACREVHDRLLLGKAMQLIVALSTELRLLPNPKQDKIGHLRTTFLTTRQELKQCRYGEDVINHSRRSWARLIVQRVNLSLFWKTQASWADFVNRLESVLDEYSHAYNLWLFMRWLQREITNLEQPTLLNQPLTKRPTTQLQPYNTFDQLFKNPVDEKRCVDALRRYRPEKPLLNEGLYWLGSQKDKGLIIAWIEAMEETNPNKIHRLTNRKELVKLLNAYFSNLEMGEHARSFNNCVDKNAKDRFTALIAS